MEIKRILWHRQSIGSMGAEQSHPEKNFNICDILSEKGINAPIKSVLDDFF